MSHPVIEGNILIDDPETSKRAQGVAQVLEEGDPLTIVAGDYQIKATVISSGKPRTARIVNGKLVRGL